MKIANPRTLTSLDEIRNAEIAFYSARTCWWTTNPDHLCDESGWPGHSKTVPLDPSGAPLFQVVDDEVEEWLRKAEENADHYGKHGIEAFILAYHGNVVFDDGRPTCAAKWASYNQLLDLAASGHLEQ